MPERSTRAIGPKVQIKRGSPRTRKAPAALNSISATPKTSEKMAQVRLRADEAASLDHSMQVLQISSTSEALREGLRLLHREATEIEAAANIRAFYQGESAPLPDGVMPVDEADLLAADDSEW
jgi:hypothetical protein